MKKWKEIKKLFNIQKENIKLITRMDDGWSFIVEDDDYFLDIRIFKNNTTDIANISVLDNKTYKLINDYII